MKTLIGLATVCRELELTEAALRHLLRRPGAPRPELHPTARVFLWTTDDVERLRSYLEQRQRAAQTGADDAR